MTRFDGLDTGLGGLARLADGKTRSISPENFDGAKGRGGAATEGALMNASRELGQGWKVSPAVKIPPKSTFTLCDIEGPGVIQHIWMTCGQQLWRNLILRMYWDDEASPSVETPYGDFFCNGWCEHSDVVSVPVQVNPAGGMNSYWPLPFRRSAKITLENRGEEPAGVFYQITYCLTPIPSDAGYFHAFWRRTDPVPFKEVHSVVDGIRGRGHYVGTYMAIGLNSGGWWGEGELKFYLDGDDDYPTICGTGTEDYFGGAYDFEYPKGTYRVFSNLYAGFHQHLKSDHLYKTQERFGMYRWHIPDPIRFESDFRATAQDLGWRSRGRFMPRQDDIATTAFWYQSEPHNPLNTDLGGEILEVI